MADLSNAKKKTAVAEIQRFGEKLIIPEGMSLKQAADLIARREAYEGQETVLQSVFNCYPWDGAAMLEKVLAEKYGWAQQVPTPGFFGDSPPARIEIECGYGKTMTVPWGQMAIPGVSGALILGAEMVKAGCFRFKLFAKVLRRDEPTIQDLFEKVRKKITEESIYRGQAIRVEFLDSDGDLLSEPTQPKFLDTASVDPSMLVLSKDLEKMVRSSLFTPITRPLDCLANGIPVKRGILLSGTFGTGKTLIAHVASKLAVEAGVTFLYIKRAKELPYAIEFAQQYQSPACAIFCEDIDREMDGDRSEDMDQILNTIDGIDSKTTNVIVVLTTNNKKGIHPAMLRPGRLDAVLDVAPPDAEAIERLIKIYAKGSLADDVDLEPVGKVLAGNIPAVIAEVVKRAKLSQLALQAPGTKVTKIGTQALLDAALSIQAQVDLLNPPEKVKRPDLEVAIGNAVVNALNGNLENISDTHYGVNRIRSALNAKGMRC